MRLLIVSHTAHYLDKKVGIVGWGPTVREIDQYSQIFEEITHIATFHPGPAPISSLPYTSPRIHLKTVSPSGGERLRDKFGIIAAYPSYWRIIQEQICHADIIQVRCPANISLLAIVMLAFSRRPQYRWVKYAGNWRPKTGEPWSCRFQRFWLEQRLHRGIVTINGRWPGQPSHIYSVMNPSFTQDELIQANSISPKSLSFPLNLIHVGGINEKKGSGQVLKIVELLKNRGIDVELHMLGDGEDRLRYENWVKEHGLESHVVFHGWLPKSELAPYYRKAHFLVFPSYSEGWPKVLSEGMAFGVVPIAGSVSCIPQVLGETKAGLAFHPDDVNAFVNAIEDYTTHPEMWAAASQAGVATSTQFTYNHFLEEIKRIFKTAWGIPLTESDQR